MKMCCNNKTMFRSPGPKHGRSGEKTKMDNYILNCHKQIHAMVYRITSCLKFDPGACRNCNDTSMFIIVWTVNVDCTGAVTGENQLKVLLVLTETIKVNISSERVQWFQGDQAKEDCCHVEALMKPHINISDQFIDVCSLF